MIVVEKLPMIVEGGSLYIVAAATHKGIEFHNWLMVQTDYHYTMVTGVYTLKCWDYRQQCYLVGVEIEP